MSPKTRATIEDLYKVEGKAELVNGKIVEMPPAGEDPGIAGRGRISGAPATPRVVQPGRRLSYRATRWDAIG